jgi:EAL domain-containing protein (putative c-di-GMP-specific phosphodiesterase class I)
MSTFGDAADGRRDDAEHIDDHGGGTLFLWFPVGLAMRKVRRHLRHAGRVFQVSASGAFAVDAPEGFPRGLVLALAEVLTGDEGADTRCVFKAGPADLDVNDIARVRTVHEIRAAEGSSWFVDLLRADRLTSVFQPIVLASETNRVLGHEALMRGVDADGSAMPAGRLIDAARGCGMLSELECAARRAAIRVAAGRDVRSQLFLNFTADDIRHGARALAPTIRAIDDAEIPRDRVVFEVIEAERATDLRQLRGVVDSVRGEGFRVSLDDIGAAEHSRRLIHEVRPDFMKLDMERMRRSAKSRMGDAERLLDLAQALRIETIAEAVETGEELEWHRERGATYVQGYFIAHPGELSAA